MLTSEAINKRKWGPFPALRRILGSRPAPESYFGPSSVSDNVFDWLCRIIEVALTSCKCEQDITGAVQDTGSNQIAEDLDKLQGELHAAMSFIEDTSRKVGNLQEAVYRAGQGPGSLKSS